MGLFQFLMIIIMILSVLLVLIVLSQNPKGGGLSSSFGGSGSQMFGVQRTNKFLDNTTWGLFIAIIILIIGASSTNSNSNRIVPIKQNTVKPIGNIPVQPIKSNANSSQNNLPVKQKK